MPRSLSMANSTRHFTSARIISKLMNYHLISAGAGCPSLYKRSANSTNYLKGAVEEVLEVCSYAKVQGGIVPLSRELRDSIAQLRDDIMRRAFGSLAVAYKGYFRCVRRTTNTRSKDSGGIGARWLYRFPSSSLNNLLPKRSLLCVRKAWK